MPDYEASYVGQLRRLVGTRKLITPGARAILRDEAGRVLLVRRADNRRWVLPAGLVEADESILECLRREVKEETGLDVLAATPIAIYSERRFDFTNAYGGQHQAFAIVFRVDRWAGTLRKRTSETLDAGFFPLDALPELEETYGETLDDLCAYDGRILVK